MFERVTTLKCDDGNCINRMEREKQLWMQLIERMRGRKEEVGKGEDRMKLGMGQRFAVL